MACSRVSSLANLILVFLVLVLCIASARANCYLPNGTDVNRLFDEDGLWQACGTTGDSMCCRLNSTSGADTCTSTGLCHNDGAPTLWRESCTDPTWTSPACLKLCISATVKIVNSTNARWPNGTAQKDSYVAIRECADGSFCCGQDNVACCQKGNGMFIVDGQVVSSTSSAASSSGSGSATRTTSGSASASTSSSSGGGGGSSNAGAIAGGVVGGIVGLALVIGGVLYFLRRRKQTAADKPRMASELDSIPRHEASGLGQQPVKFGKVGAVPQPQGPAVVQVPGTHEMSAT